MASFHVTFDGSLVLNADDEEQAEAFAQETLDELDPENKGSLVIYEIKEIKKDDK